MSRERQLADQDYWSIVLRQFRRNRLGLAGLAVILFMFTVAVFAPFLAESKPLKLTHANPEDKPCRVCRKLGDDSRVLKLKDGRELEGKILKSTPEEVLFSSGSGEQRFPRAEIEQILILPRSHGPVTTWPLLRALRMKDYLLLSAYLTILLSAPLLWLFRRRGRTRMRALGLALLWLSPILVPLYVFTLVHESEVHRLDRVDFKRLEERYLTPEDSVTWTPIPFSPYEIDKGVMPYSKPYPHRFGENDEHIAKINRLGDGWKERAQRHILGTDNNRRDVLAILIHASRVSLSVGFVSVSIYVTVGIIMGALAGFFGGVTDSIIMRIIEVIICFPILFLIITILALVPPSIYWVMLAIAIVGWTTVARLIRAEFLKLRQNDFVASARALGASSARIIFRHVLPNAISPVFVSATFGIAGAILMESALSFLGIGVPPEEATWGNVLRIGREVVRTDWWLALWAGLAIFVTVTSFNLIGESLRDAMDPRLKGTR